MKARTKASAALIAMPAFAAMDRDGCCVAVTIGVVLFAELLDRDGADGGGAPDKKGEDEDEDGELSIIVWASAPQLPNLLLQPFPQ
jgi:hypothetical protein